VPVLVACDRRGASHVTRVDVANIATITQVLRVAKPNNGSTPNKMPAAVATPLPPLKLKNTGHK
jgi:hypothetical protein